jgi:putative ABC transport system permease protein
MKNRGPQLSWGTAGRIAWRELRASRAKFLFVVLAVAVGIGSLTGVRSFSRAFRHMLLSQARTLMAGDMTLRIFGEPTAQQQAVLQGLDGRGVRRTLITETVTMASSPSGGDPLLISLKAVDPHVYPFYGEVKLQPPQPLARALTAQTVVVSDDLLLRLGMHTGDSLRIGGEDFRIAGVLASEPDRMTGTLNVGPRVMLTREGLQRTGLITLGSRASERFLFRLPATGQPTVNGVRSTLKQSFPEATLADYTETHPIITRGLDRATTFLSLIALIALVIGAMGVGSAMHAHLRQKLDSIAVLKCLGAHSAQIIRIYTTQTCMLGLAGGVLGGIFGMAVAAVFPGLIAHYFTMDLASSFDAWPALEGIAIALLVTLLFTLPPLLSIRAVRPAQVFRRDMSSERRPRSSAAHLARLAILLGTAALAATLTEGTWRDALRTGAYFAAALAAGIGLLAAAAWLLLALLRSFERRALHLPAGVRHGLANLHRPGNQAQAAVVALGVGVMFTLMVFLIQGALVRQIRGSAPPGMPNVFLLDIPGAERQAISDLVKAQPGVAGPPDVAMAVAARITAVNGQPAAALGLRDMGRRLIRTRSITEMAEKPPETAILSGAWWNAGDTRPQVCVSEETARMLHLAPGGVIDWEIWQHALRTRVACIERTESIRMTARFEFLLSPGHLEGFPAVYYGSANVRPNAVTGLQRVLYARFPTVTVVNVADVMQIIEDVVSRIALVIRFISAFTILAGVVMVASSIAGTRFRRMREVVILKTLGATRRRIAWIFSVEFLALGAVAGLMGSVLASAFAALWVKRLLDIEYHPDWFANAFTVVMTAVVAAAAGWAASFRVLGRKPLEILREE